VPVPGQIVVVRHSETEWSLGGRHTSRTDLPLTARGRERAARLPSCLAGRKFALVMSSPLRRALETCELAGLRDAAVVTDDLREWDYGDYEGLTTPDIREANPTWNLWTDGCPGGESPAEVSARADRALAALRHAGDGDAIAFAHGHILRVLAARWIEMDVTTGARLALSAGAVCEFGYERETPVLTLWNGGPH
jgi:broad specificity phosphatase PhoE